MVISEGSFILILRETIFLFCLFLLLFCFILRYISLQWRTEQSESLSVLACFLLCNLWQPSCQSLTTTVKDHSSIELTASLQMGKT